ncbi:hypothetical protein LNQ52_00025 [Klebsiella pneumoniae subsp. pneumoniae]|nr:hypothetical protein [Klebsiella pneumoniae subsp. pneumoniae]
MQHAPLLPAQWGIDPTMVGSKVRGIVRFAPLNAGRGLAYRPARAARLTR